jgi:hypothetical protein
VLFDIVLFVVGLVIVVSTSSSAVRTVVISHGGSVRLAQEIFSAACRVGAAREIVNAHDPSIRREWCG